MSTGAWLDTFLSHSWKTEEIISAVAAAVSFVSMLIASRSHSISKRALQLSESDHNEKKLPVSSYLIDALSFKKDGEKFCAFAIVFTNQSSVSQTFSLLDLEIEFRDEDGVSGKVVASPDAATAPLGVKNNYVELIPPLNLGPRETVSGWVTFKIPVSSHRKYRIESYRVVGRAGDGRQSSVEAHLLRDVTNEKSSD